MRIFIIDNEPLAVEHLKKLLKELIPQVKIAGSCTTVADALQWLTCNKSPDLTFAAVELEDGLSFEIFRKLDKRMHVIFTCKHEKHAIDAFRANGIFYILKPVKKADIQEALAKYKLNYVESFSVKSESALRYQKRFLIYVGQQLKLIKTDDIAYFYTENKIVYVVTFDEEKHVMKFSLEELEHLLDPGLFFRINRQFIINLSAIVKLAHASKSRFQVFLKPRTDYITITSSGRTNKFCNWMLGDLQVGDRALYLNTY